MFTLRIIVLKSGFTKTKTEVIVDLVLFIILGSFLQITNVEGLILITKIFIFQTDYHEPISTILDSY